MTSKHGELLWIVLLGAAGLAANELLSFTVHSGATFRFGTVFTLFAAIALGPASGALSAVIAGSGLAVDGELHMALLAVAEAWVVGHLVQRRTMPLSADLLFWAVGSPLLLAWTASRLGFSSAAAWVPALHAPVNGALCVVLADIFLLLWATRIPGPRCERRQSLRRHLVHWLAFAILVPMLVVGLSVGRERAAEQAAAAEDDLRAETEGVARALDGLVAENLRAVESLARVLTTHGALDTAELIAHLDAYRVTYGPISTLLVADRTGQVIAGSPELSRDGERWWGGSVADRQYFQIPMATGGSVVTDVFRGSGFASNPIIGLGAPVFGPDGETVERVVEASVAVRELRRRVPSDEPVGGLMVVDRGRRVLFTLGDRLERALQPMPQEGLAGAVRERPAGGELRLDGDAAASSGGHGGPSALAVWRPVPAAGWTVIGEMPSRVADLAAARVYLSYASGLLLAVVLTSLFASAIARRLTGPLERLVETLRHVEADSLPDVPAATSTAPREVAELVDSFGAMSGRLESSYRRLRQSLEERQQLLGDLDRRVRERTAELAASRRDAVELQRLYRGLLDDIEAIVCEYDLTHGRFTFVSRRTREILGYPPETWYEDRGFWLRLLPEPDRGEMLDVLQRLMAEGGHYAVEHAILTATGEQLTLRNVGRVLLDDDGAKVLRCVMLDVTAAKRQQEDQLRRRQLEAVGTLAGGIAHDFNNLLTTILGNLSLVELENETGGDPSTLLAEIQRAGHDARRLSHQLLTFARGGQPILKACNLERRLRALETVGEGEGAVRVEVHLPDVLPKVLADRQQLHQVIHELMRNAAQAMPSGGVIEVEAREEPVASGSELPVEPGPYVAFTVRDGGEGVPADIMTRVFDPYFTTKDEGRGFGLAATYSIVRSHGGHISFQSTRGQGTSVTVWLPAATGEAEVPAPTASPAEPAGPGRVLLMDDEASVRRVAGRMFERLGWRVTVTADGEEAVTAYAEALAQDDRYDLVITDLTVPGGLGGAETMRRLLDLDRRIRAIVCSGYSNDPVMARYRDHGFAGVMTKPFGLVDLQRVVEQTMREPLAEVAERR